MMHKFSYEHNRSIIRALHHKIIGKYYLKPNYINLVIKIIKSYTNCDIIAVVMGIILSIYALLKSIIGKKLSRIGRA